MKKSQYLIFALCVILICVGCWLFLFSGSAEHNDLQISFKEIDQCKLNESIDPVSLIESTTSTKILYPTIDTSSPGVKKLLYIAVGEQGEQKEFMKEIRIVDPIPPVLQLKQDTVEIYVNDPFDALSYVKSASSNYDGKLPVKVSGSYKLTKAGTYTLIYAIEDSSGNKVSKKLTLYVREKKKQIDYQKNQEKIQDGTEKKSENTPEKQPELAEREMKAPSPSGNAPTQTWMFADGESFDSAMAKCNAAGAASGRRYQCEVLQDSAGIFTGYRLVLP